MRQKGSENRRKLKYRFKMRDNWELKIGFREGWANIFGLGGSTATVWLLRKEIRHFWDRTVSKMIERLSSTSIIYLFWSFSSNKYVETLTRIYPKFFSMITKTILSWNSSNRALTVWTPHFRQSPSDHFSTVSSPTKNSKDSSLWANVVWQLCVSAEDRSCLCPTFSNIQITLK